MMLIFRLMVDVMVHYVSCLCVVRSDGTKHEQG